MRHIILCATLILSVLVPSRAFGGDNSGAAQEAWKANANQRKQKQNKEAQKLRLKLKNGEQEAFNSGYEALGDADQTKFTDIVMSAIEVDNASVNQKQLLGFMQFTKANPTAKCSMINASDEDMKSQFVMYKDEKTQKKLDKATNADLFRKYLEQEKKKTVASAVTIRPALMCIAGSSKMLFTGLPASTLNRYYNDNIMLASEAAAVPPVADDDDDTDDTGGVVVVASVPTQPVTGYSNYLSQSLNDSKSEMAPATVFDSSAPEAEVKMHFSNDPGAKK